MQTITLDLSLVLIIFFLFSKIIEYLRSQRFVIKNSGFKFCLYFIKTLLPGSQIFNFSVKSASAFPIISGRQTLLRVFAEQKHGNINKISKNININLDYSRDLTKSFSQSHIFFIINWNSNNSWTILLKCLS